MFEKRGTPYYIAPEVLQERYTAKCDIWSIGVIAYILLSAAPPFTGNTDEQILEKVQDGKVTMVQGWQGISDKAKEFVKGCLTVDPAQRFDAQQALDSPWIVQFGTLPCDQNVASVALENLKKFKSDQTLKSATFSFIAS